MGRLSVNCVITYCGNVPTSFFFQQKKAVPLIFQSKNLVYTILVFFCFNILNVRGFEQSNISYVDECKADCARHRDPFTCGKFRAVQWLHNLTTNKDIHYGSIRFIRVSTTTEEPILPQIPKFRGFGSYSKFLNFLRYSAEDMLTSRALVYTVEQSASSRSLSSGPLILDTEELDEFVESERSAEGRLHKKKKKALSIVLPLLILLKVIKLKLLLIPILIGVHFIKKIILLGALALPSILANLKYCKIPPMPHQQTAYNTWTTAAEAPIDFSVASGYEDESDGWSQKIDVMGYGGGGTYDALIAKRNPYRYYQALKQQQLHNVM